MQLIKAVGWWMMSRRIMQVLPLPLWPNILQQPVLIYCWGWHSDSLSNFCSHFLSLTHKGDSWIYSISWLALCFAEQSIQRQASPLYRDLQQLQMRDSQSSGGTGWRWALQYCIHMQRWASGCECETGTLTHLYVVSRLKWTCKMATWVILRSSSG